MANIIKEYVIKEKEKYINTFNNKIKTLDDYILNDNFRRFIKDVYNDNKRRIKYIRMY